MYCAGYSLFSLLYELLQCICRQYRAATFSDGAYARHCRQANDVSDSTRQDAHTDSFNIRCSRYQKRRNYHNAPLTEHEKADGRLLTGSRNLALKKNPL